MRILLTGANGFIGSQVAECFARDGHPLIFLLRPGSDESRIAHLVASASVIRGDISDLKAAADQIKAAQPEVCVHMAWYAEPGKYLTSLENVILLRSSIELALLLNSIGCKRFVGAGTCFEYATSDTKLDESSATDPATIYAAAKLSLFEFLERFAKTRGMSFAWLRFFYQYGPHEHPARLVPNVTLKLLRNERAPVSSGEQIRDFLHVSDVGRAACAVALSDLEGAVNIGSGEPVSIREIVETIARITNRPDALDFGAFPQRAGDPPYICADNSRLRSTGWKPRFDLQSGLTNTIDWWRSHIPARSQ
jgi:nucleoside-diphosphate-sugar epimerase